MIAINFNIALLSYRYGPFVAGTRATACSYRAFGTIILNARCLFSLKVRHHRQNIHAKCRHMTETGSESGRAEHLLICDITVALFSTVMNALESQKILIHNISRIFYMQH